MNKASSKYEVRGSKYVLSQSGIGSNISLLVNSLTPDFSFTNLVLSSQPKGASV